MACRPELWQEAAGIDVELAILRARVLEEPGNKASAGPLALRLARRLEEEGTSEALAEAAGLCEGILDAAERQAEGDGVAADEVRALLLGVQRKQGAAAAASPSVSQKSGTPRRPKSNRRNSKRKAPDTEPSDVAAAAKDPMGSAIDSSGKVPRKAAPGRTSRAAASIEDIEMVSESVPLPLSDDVATMGASSSWRGAGSSAAEEAPRAPPVEVKGQRPSTTNKDAAAASLEASKCRGGSLPISVNSETTAGRTDGSAASACVGLHRGGASEKATTGHQHQPPKGPVNVRDLIAGLLDSDDDEDDGLLVGMSATAGSKPLTSSAAVQPDGASSIPSQGPPSSQNPTGSLATQGGAPGGVAALLKDLYDS